MVKTVVNQCTAKMLSYVKRPLRGYSSFSELALEAAEHNDAFMSLHTPSTG